MAALGCFEISPKKFFSPRFFRRFPPLLQEAPRHEAVLGRKVRLVIWDTTSGGKRKRKKNPKYLGKGEGKKGRSKERPAAEAAAFAKISNLLLSLYPTRESTERTLSIYNYRLQVSR